MSRKKHLLAIDIGGTKLAAAIFDSKNNMVGRSRMATRAEEGPEAVISRIGQLAEKLMKRNGVDSRSLSLVGVGCVGPLDSETGIVYSPPNLPGWDAFPLRQKLEEMFGAPAFIDNDANAAALAEQRFGAGCGYNNIIYITVSTGIGAGFILDGRLYRGSDFSAGEFGHIVMGPHGPKCNCGGRACLEALASGTAIARIARSKALRTPGSQLAKVMDRNGGAISAKDVVQGARAGDKVAGSIIEKAATYIGLGVTTAIHMLNPDIIIIGGGLSRSGKMLFDPIRRTVAERAQKHLAGHVPIVPAKLGNKVGIYGALAVALDQQSSL